ncbi:unnamed protein product, partial [Tetraodon nigroviridis]
EIVELPDYNKISFTEQPAMRLDALVPDAPPQAVRLLRSFLLYPSQQRCPARQVGASARSAAGLPADGCRPPAALLHPYFFSAPLPAHHSELPAAHRAGRPPRQPRRLPADFSLDLPLESSLVDAALLRTPAACL